MRLSSGDGLHAARGDEGCCSNVANPAAETMNKPRQAASIRYSGQCFERVCTLLGSMPQPRNGFERVAETFAQPGHPTRQPCCEYWSSAADSLAFTPLSIWNDSWRLTGTSR